MIKTPLDKIWEEKPEYIRQYYQLQNSFSELCEEVEHVLKTKLKEHKIEFGNTHFRVKSLKSVCEKIIRKNYDDPFCEITDFSGVRIVYLYLSDLKTIKEIIEQEFDIVEKVDKLESHGEERFGYVALHYVVKIKQDYTGTRYEHIKDIPCEIQVRTISQDAWAIIAHHLSYKHEEDIPQELRRKLNALAGLFEIADDQFEGIRHARNTYQEKVVSEISQDSEINLEKEINLDNLIAYMNWKFPQRREGRASGISQLLSELQKVNFKNLKKVDEQVNSAIDAVIAYEKDSPPVPPDWEPCDDYDEDEPDYTDYNRVGLIRQALRFANKRYREQTSDYDFPYSEYKHLLKKNKKAK